MLPLQRSPHHRLRYVPEDRGHETPCWIWQMSTQNGYGALGVNYKVVRAHRFFYEQLVGPIPEGHDVHHKCDQQLCVNPDHLEVLTEQEHMRLHHVGNTYRRGLRSATCRRGHPQTPENVYEYSYGRRCKRCDLERYAVKKAAA